MGLELRTLCNASDVDYFHLRYAESLEKSLKAIELSRHVEDPSLQMAAYHFAARSLIRAGELKMAQQYAVDMLAAAEKLRVRGWLASAYWTNASLGLQALAWSCGL